MPETNRQEAELGVLGTGRMGSRLAATFARAGHRVILASRDSGRAEALVRELGIPTLSAGCYSDALRAPAIVPAVFIRDGLFDLLDRHSAKLSGKLVIDISNPFNAATVTSSRRGTPAQPRNCSAVSRKPGSSAHSRTCSGKCSIIRNSAKQSAMCSSPAMTQKRKRASFGSPKGRPSVTSTQVR